MRLKQFFIEIFHYCPTLQPFAHQWDKILEHFVAYKVQVPVYGCILLNEDRKKCLMVKGWNVKSCWGLSQGQGHEDELPHHCAAREVEEEIGFDVGAYLKQEDYIEYHFKRAVFGQAQFDERREWRIACGRGERECRLVAWICGWYSIWN